MKHVLVCEYFGRMHDQYNNLVVHIYNEAMPGVGDYFKLPSRKPWCAEITGICKKYGLNRKFLKQNQDLKYSSSNGNRGINLRFVVDSGQIYEVKRQISWKKSERFFFRYECGVMIKMGREEVIRWLTKNHQA